MFIQQALKSCLLAHIAFHLMIRATQANPHAGNKESEPRCRFSCWLPTPKFDMLPIPERRFETSLLLGFSAIALLMAAIGVYGLIQYSIATRTHEIAIRLAVGAQAGEIFRMVIGEGLKLCLSGLALGLAGALGFGRAVSSLLFGVTATDPATYVSVSLLLVSVAIAACYFPARRAMRIEPVAALRQG